MILIKNKSDIKIIIVIKVKSKNFPSLGKHPIFSTYSLREIIY